MNCVFDKGGHLYEALQKFYFLKLVKCSKIREKKYNLLNSRHCLHASKAKIKDFLKIFEWSGSEKGININILELYYFSILEHCV